ncbi:MAG: hypothetical protein QXG17_01580 [Sulfolobales archaeon]
METKVRVEKSVSRSGLHMRISTYFTISKDCIKVTSRVLDKAGVKPTYAKGEAYDALVEIPPGTFLVALDVRRNPRRKVRGDVTVYSSAGTVVFKAVYRKLKIRLIECHIDQSQAYSIIKCVVDLLKLPVKRYGLSRCKS